MNSTNSQAASEPARAELTAQYYSVMMTMSRAQVTTFLVQVLLPLLVVLLLGPIHCRADVSAQPTPPSGTAVPDYAKAAAQYQSTQDIVNRVWPKLSPEVRSYLDVQLRPRSQVRPMVTAPGSVGISAAAANAATQDEISGRCVLGLRRMISLANLTSPATLACEYVCTAAAAAAAAVTEVAPAAAAAAAAVTEVAPAAAVTSTVASTVAVLLPWQRHGCCHCAWCSIL